MDNKQIIMPGHLYVEIVNQEDRNIADVMKIYNDKQDIWAKVVDHAKWNGDEFLNATERFLYNFILTGWMYRIGLIRRPIKLKQYPRKGDKILMPGVTTQSYYDGKREFKFVHITEVRKWEKS